METSERFWSKVDTGGRCWIWLASVSPSGYGKFRLSDPRRLVAAHRFAYELEVGPIPEGLDLDHLCRNRGCVNPAHLEPVTRSENVRRGTKGRLVTHCPQGHEYDEANTYVSPQGLRHCRRCRRERELARYHRLKEQNDATRAKDSN